MLGKLTDAQMQSLLTSQALGRIACTDGIQPYIVPITYAYDGHYIYGHSNEGQKISIMRKNPHVCFEVDRMTDMANWQCVLINGVFEELTGKDAEEARGIFFDRVFPLITSSTVHPHEHGVEHTIDDSNRIKFVMFRIRITHSTGRFEKQ